MWKHVQTRHSKLKTQVINTSGCQFLHVFLFLSLPGGGWIASFAHFSTIPAFAYSAARLDHKSPRSHRIFHRTCKNWCSDPKDFYYINKIFSAKNAHWHQINHLWFSSIVCTTLTAFSSFKTKVRKIHRSFFRFLKINWGFTYQVISVNYPGIFWKIRLLEIILGYSSFQVDSFWQYVSWSSKLEKKLT